MQSNPEAIIFLIPGFADDEKDTSCLPALQDFILAWKGIFPGIRYSIISFQKPFHKKGFIWNDIPVYSARGRNRKGIFRLMTWTSVFFRLFQTKNKKSTVLISYFLTEATFIGSIFSRMFSMKHIAIAAGQDVLKSNPFLRKINLRKSTVVVFNKRMAASLVDSCGRQADYIIPMGIERSLLKFSASLSRPVDVLMVGSLISLKQMDKGIQLVARLKKRFPFIHCEISGDGPEKKYLTELVWKNELERNIVFTGSLPREDVFEKMMNAKILLHTSAYEGQATVITEALAAGMTIVCFDIGRITDHEKIIVCNNVEEMEQVIEKLLEANSFNFVPVIPVTSEETVRQFHKIISH